MTLNIEIKYEIGDYVYLITDEDQLLRIVFAYQINNSGLLYGIAQGKETSWHYEFELHDEKSFK